MVLDDLVREWDLRPEIRVVGGSPDRYVSRPGLLARYALHDSRSLAREWGLHFPATQIPGKKDVLRAQHLLLKTSDGSERLSMARFLSMSLFSGETLPDIRPDPGLVRPVLARHMQELLDLGHYQGGMLYYEGEWFWGLDRLDHLSRGLQLDAGRSSEEAVPVQPVPVGPVRDGRPLDFYFSFRSPYSWLALERMLPEWPDQGVRIQYKPVMPMVMRGVPVPSIKRYYILRDAHREARRYGIPFGRIADPHGQGALNCLVLFLLAREKDVLPAFLTSVCRGIWAEGRDVSWSPHLRRLVERAGLDWDEARQALDSAAAMREGKELAETNLRELTAMGMWGVPCFGRPGEEPIWGQDRLDRVVGRRTVIYGQIS